MRVRADLPRLHSFDVRFASGVCTRHFVKVLSRREGVGNGCHSWDDGNGLRKSEDYNINFYDVTAILNQFPFQRKELAVQQGISDGEAILPSRIEGVQASPISMYGGEQEHLVPRARRCHHFEEHVGVHVVTGVVYVVK